MIKQKLVDMLAQAARQAQESGKLPSVALPEATIERPQNPEHGDYASSLPLKLARATGVNPLTIANDMVELMTPIPEIATVVGAPPGFINFTLNSDWLTQQVVHRQRRHRALMLRKALTYLPDEQRARATGEAP